MIHSSVYKRLPSPNEIMYCSLNHEAVRAAPSANPQGGEAGGPDPLWKITNYMGFYRKYAIGHPLEKVGPPGKNWTPSGALKNDRFL